MKKRIDNPKGSSEHETKKTLKTVTNDVNDMSGTSERRCFLKAAGAGFVALTVALPTVLSVRSCVPNVLYEPPMKFKIGELAKFPEGSTFLRDFRIFIFREANTLHCISAKCTHLGCTVQLTNVAGAEGGFEFHCPCHGSKFKSDGANFAGPAPKALDYYQLEVSPDDGQLIVDASITADKNWRLTV